MRDVPLFDHPLKRFVTFRRFPVNRFDQCFHTKQHGFVHLDLQLRFAVGRQKQIDSVPDPFLIVNRIIMSRLTVCRHLMPA